MIWEFNKLSDEDQNKIEVEFEDVPAISKAIEKYKDEALERATIGDKEPIIENNTSTAILTAPGPAIIIIITLISLLF